MFAYRGKQESLFDGFDASGSGSGRRLDCAVESGTTASAAFAMLAGLGGGIWGVIALAAALQITTFKFKFLSVG